MGRVVHFEITADNADRAAKFYEKAFGWKIESWGGPMTYKLAATGDKAKTGIDGAIMNRSDYKQAVINTIDVPNYDQAAKAVRDAGGQVVQDKHAVPGVGWFSYCKDTEGNVFGIMQADDQAK